MMTPQEIDRIQCAIRHIQTAVDVDPWAMEISVEAMEKQIPKKAQKDLQPTCNQLATDCISRQAAIDAAEKESQVDGAYGYMDTKSIVDLLNDLPSAQPEPSEITDEQAILHLQSTGWMQNHDREMYESGLRERLADDSGSYDSLIPCEDAISRTVAIDAFEKECLQPESEYVFYDSDHGFCINTQDVLDCLRKELRNG